MTIQDIHLAMDIEIDKSLSLEYPYIHPEVKDYWLNKAQIIIVDEYSHPSNPNSRGFEHGERRIDELREITVISNELTPSSFDAVYEVDLPNDYFRLVRHRCEVSNNSDTKILNTGGIQSTQDEMNAFLKNPFWEPVIEDPLFYILGNKIYYETKNKFKVNSTVLTYLKEPTKMRYGSIYSNPTSDIQCIFTNEDMQHKIIDKAVRMLLENLESQRYQTNLNEVINK